MSDNVEIINGEAQMAYTGEVPWHGLGTRVTNDLSPRQMQKVAGLDWKVSKVKSFIEVDGKKIFTGQESVVRDMDNKVLTNVGGSWNPVQNDDAFDFFNEFVQAGDMEMHTAGSLKGGKIVFALAKVRESFEVMEGDQVDSYLLFSNPHEFGKAVDVRFTPIRVVCNNTLTMALNSGSKNFVKIGHRSEFNPDVVKEKMGLASARFKEYKEVAEFMAKKRFSPEALIQYYNDIFPHTYGPSKGKEIKEKFDLTKNAQDAMAVLETQPGAEFGAGTWWQAFNSVTFLTDHKLGNTTDSRITSAWYGQNQARKVKALNKAVEYAKAA